MDSSNWLIVLLLIVVLVVPFVGLLQRANELFVLEVQRGEVTVVRGRVPPSLLRDLRDVLRNTPQATISARMENGLPMVRAERLAENTLQRVRNVVGRFSKAQFKRN